jgi:hypothetical protein
VRTVLHIAPLNLGQVSTFSLDQLEPLAQNIERLKTASILQIASEAAKIHEIFRYCRNEGGYAGYMKKRLGYSRSGAYRLLDVNARFAGNVSQVWDTLPKSAVYLLANSSTPKEAFDEIKIRAEAGEKFTFSAVRKVVTSVKKPTEISSDDEKSGDEDVENPDDEHASSTAKVSLEFLREFDLKLLKLNRSQKKQLKVFARMFDYIFLACEHTYEEVPHFLNEGQKAAVRLRLKALHSFLHDLEKRLAGEGAAVDGIAGELESEAA